MTIYLLNGNLISNVCEIKHDGDSVTYTVINLVTSEIVGGRLKASDIDICTFYYPPNKEIL